MRPITNVEEARGLMHEWTPSAALRVHMECVAACMGAYARELAPDAAERWVIAGLLHDFDYEKHPTPDPSNGHPFVGVAYLRSIGADEEIVEAIMGHAAYTGVQRTTPMAKALFAVDELAGFIVACAKVRPEGVATLEPKSVVKKLKDKAFAAAVSREDIAVGLEELTVLFEGGLERSEHIGRCIASSRGEAGRLGL